MKKYPGVVYTVAETWWATFCEGICEDISVREKIASWMVFFALFDGICSIPAK